MQAIILAAGMGKRLKELTRNNTKCMVKVNGVTLIERMLRQIEKQHLSRIVIVVGYEGEKLKSFITSLRISTPVVFIDNPIYDKTNNIYSLALAKDWLCSEDTILFESDLIFEDQILEDLIHDPRETLTLVDKYESWMDGTCVKLSDDDRIEAFVPGKHFRFSEAGEYYKTVNIYKFSRSFSMTHYVPFLIAYQAALGENEYYEQVLRVITMLDNPMIQARRLNGQKWYEIDDLQDLNIAESLFAPDEEEQARLLQKRYGGYWRYPKLRDFCYLVNPYYPPARMKEELRANMDILLTQYPSGMEVNSLLAARNFGVRRENIVVGNGAAELIRSLMSLIPGRIGIVRPTFEEYPHRCLPEQIVSFCPDNPDFSYTAEDLFRFFSAQEIRCLILINPDNPSGNYLPRTDLLDIISRTGEKGIALLVDESFADFADEENNSLLDQSLLDRNPHLMVMKSISKSYGVPGLRLGVLASGNTELVSRIKKDVAIWNINSFAEFYMQIEEKYRKDYEDSLKKLRAERARFAEALSSVRHLRVIPSQANYLMVELQDGIRAKKLLKTLLAQYQLLIKDLTDKTGGKEYIRLAVRCKEDNDMLINALRKELGDKT